MNFKVKNIYVKGYYGYQNLGDDIFVITADYIFGEYFKKSKGIIVGNHLPNTYNLKIIKRKSKLMRRLSEFMNLINTHFILYFGGSVFFNGGSNIFNLKYWIRKYRKFQNKVIAYGNSIGPFLNDEDYKSAKSMLIKFRYIGVRDYKSLDILENMALDHSRYGFVFDNAIIIREMYPSLLKTKTSRKGKIEIGISLCRNTSNLLLQSKIENQIMSTLDLIVEDNPNIKLNFFVFNGNDKLGDKTISIEFFNRYKNIVECSIIDYSTDTLSLINQLKQQDFILGIRLHSGILAYALDVPFILGEYHKKCTEFLRTIEKKIWLTDNINENAKNIMNIINGNINEEIVNPDFFLNTTINQIKKLATELEL